MAHTPRPFFPKPFGLGSIVEVDDVLYRVQSPGPLPASVWAEEVKRPGVWASLKLPTPSRPARVLGGNLRADGYPLAKEAAA